MKSIFVFIMLVFSNFLLCQSEEQLPYYEIPEYSEEFTTGTISARMVDALGFRFH